MTKRKQITTALFTALQLCALGLLVGVLGGGVGAAFSRALALVTHVRAGSPWLVLLLPLGGVATVALYRLCGMSDHKGTNEVIRCLGEKRPVRAMAAPLIFVAAAITHLLGGSAGREGAALQLGGAGASAVSRLLRLRGDRHAVMILCGMSAVFAGVFGTPLTAAFFVLEFKTDKKTLALGAVPCLLAALAAKGIAALLGVEAETMTLAGTAPFTAASVGKVAVLAVGLSLLGTAMCFLFHKAEAWAGKGLPNPFLRAALGAVLLVAMTALVGDMRYNGSGMPLAVMAVEGEAAWFDFALKLAFTAVTLAAGFKGGEIVPTFCIGATFGCVLGGLLGLDMGFAAALGLVGLFACVANSVVGAVFLGLELFGLPALPYVILLCLILWPLSAKHGLFHNRVFCPVYGRKKQPQPPVATS